MHSSRFIAASVSLLFLLTTLHGLTVAPQERPERRRGRATTRPASDTERGGAERSGRQEGDQEKKKSKKNKKKKKPRPGIPVTDALMLKHCASCHTVEKGDIMGRISHIRKTPEGWGQTLKRMIRQNDLIMTPEEARHIVRYLANDHGLARQEAERALYEAERRVHWSESAQDEDLRKTCSGCHTLGRVLSQQRDSTEWKRLKSMHLAFFPLSDFQAFRGRRGRRGGRGGRGSEDRSSESEGRSRGGPDRADKVLGQLAKDYPLFTKEWEAWQVNRREVPLQGMWFVNGHERSRGDVRGTVKITRLDEDTYETSWELNYGDGRVVRRKGKSLLYAGYSWRGRSTPNKGTPDSEPRTLREVLLLSENWNHLKGRIFTGGYNELGMDVTLHRLSAAASIFAVAGGAVMTPSKGHVIDVWGTSFADELSPADFNVGQGVTVTQVEQVDVDHVRLVVDVARDAQQGARRISYRASLGPESVVLYDTIDYIKVTPEQGFARIGGKTHPKQLERFEALAMNRGKDEKLYTKDDFVVKVVKASWKIEEFPVREDDDDAKFVGLIDSATGVFTPGREGPNPERKWQANNIGDVYVVATCKLRVQERPEKPKEEPEEEKKPEKKSDGDTPAPDPKKAEVKEPVKPKKEVAPMKPAPIVMIDKEFRARGHLLVTVPLYVRWDRYEWDKR